MSTVRNGQYNEGALSGRYALKDLSNTGRFSNCMNVIPHRTQVTTSGVTITVSMGSTLTLLSGLSESDLSPYNTYPQLTKDYTVTASATIVTSADDAEDPTAFQYLVYNPDADRLELGTTSAFTYHEEADSTSGADANTFVNEYGQRVTLPIGYIDDKNAWHTFNSVGFFGNLAWVDVGVEALCPSGRDDKGALSVDKVTISSVTFTQFETNELNTFTDGICLIGSDGTLTMTDSFLSTPLAETIESGYNYVTDENIIYDYLGYQYDGCKLCMQSMTNGMFLTMNSFNTYAPANFSEISDRITELDNSVLHCTGAEDVTEDVYGVKYFHDNVTFDDITINGGTLTNISIEDPLIVECPDITSDYTALTNLSATSKYSGEYGGLFVKYDAYLTSVGDPTSNPNLANHIQLVGASACGQAGISFGNKQTVRLLGNSGEGNLYLTLANGGALLPRVTQQYNIGSTSYQFKAMYALDFIGKASSAYWADLAEVYKTDVEYPIGTIVKWGGEEELTIADDEADLAGVISNEPGYLMNSDGEGQPMALAGRVHVRIIGKVNKHDKIILSDIAGVGISVNCIDDCVLKGIVVGRALEDKDTDEEGLVLCAVKFSV